MSEKSSDNYFCRISDEERFWKKPSSIYGLFSFSLLLQCDKNCKYRMGEPRQIQ